MNNMHKQPCLRCGNENIKVVEITYGIGIQKYYKCECGNRHSWDEWSNTKIEAINSWNEKPFN